MLRTLPRFRPLLIAPALLALASPAAADPPAFEALPESLVVAATALRDEALRSSDAHAFLTANEEFGLSGAKAYGERHAKELERHTAALESDFGIGLVLVFRSRVEEDRMPLVRDLERLLAPLGIAWAETPAFGGADLRPLKEARVPFFDLPQDATDYFDYHHTANDTLDKLSADDLKQNVAAYVTAAYVLAETEVDLGRAPEEEEE